MDIRDIREIMGLSQAQVADELGVPKQEVIDCEENGETYLLLQYISAFPINPQIMKNPDEDPFLPSFDQTTPGHRMAQWREKNGLSARDVADALGMSEEDLARFEAGENNQFNRRRGEEIEKKTGINRKWLMYGDGRDQGTPRMQAAAKTRASDDARGPRTPAPNKAAGQRIRQARQDAGMSREELSDLLDLSVSRIAQMESGYVRDQKADHILSRIAAASSSEVRESPKDAGIRLRDARKAAGLSVKEAAEIVQLKYTTLAHLESGYITGKRADELIAMIQNAPGREEKHVFDPKEAGARIREERIRAGLSQKELGTIMRYPVTRISLIELGNVTEKDAENILRRIHGKPSREIMQKRVRKMDQVLLGSRIRDARVEAGLSQKELGDLMELPQTRISLIERGKVDQATADQILQALAKHEETAAAEAAEKRPAPEPRTRKPLMPELGQRIQAARKEAKLSQKDVADMLGLSQGSVSYMEQGRVDEETAEKVLRLIQNARKEK